MNFRPFASLAVGALLAGCGGDSTLVQAPPSPQNATRTVAMSINPRPVPPPGLPEIVAAVDLVASAGVKGTPLTYTWKQLEPAAGSYQLTDLANGVSYFGNARGFDIELGIQVINTVPREVPPDLANTAFDAAEMKSRFHALLDALKPLLNSHVRYLSIGNEVDVYLEAHPAEWVAYRNFYEDALDYAHGILAGIKVGVTATFGGASGSSRQNVAQLNTRSDVWVLTYYPLQAGFLVQAPDAPLRDFPGMLQMASGKPIVLQEVGYPAATLLNSSEARQEQFVSNVFLAWQAARTRIPFLSVFLLHDLTDDVCDTLLQYYGLPGDAAFKAYLCTLGLRHTDGSAKPAWQTFATRAAAVAANP